MPHSELDRRRAVRRTPQPDETLSRVRLRTGRELTVVNISASGALLEGLTRLLPNTHSDLHVVTRHGRVLIRARVVRAFVWRLERDVVCYRTALAFDTAVDAEVDAGLDQRGAPSGLAVSERCEANGPALSERDDSNGPALSERSSRRGRDECEPKGYQIPAEIPGNFTRPGTPYPNSEVEDRV